MKNTFPSRARSKAILPSVCLFLRLVGFDDLNFHGSCNSRIELPGFCDALEEDFFILPVYHAGDAEEVDDPPDFSDNAAP